MCATTTRVAFIGAGNRSIGHMATLTHLPDIEIVALTDLDVDRAQTAQAYANERRSADAVPIDASIFTDYRRMLDEAAPDCIYLCLPPFAHGQIDHDLIDYGRPIFFEKPLTVDMGLAKEIGEHVRQSGIVNAAGYQKRYSSAVRQAAAMLEGVSIGMAITIRLSGLPGQPWWRVQAQSGGMLVEQHTHAVDLMRVLCGEVESAYAVGATNLLADVPNLTIFDCNACTLRFANGAPGIIGNSCAAPAGGAVYPPHTVQVVAPDMVLNVNEKKSTIFRTGQEPEEILREEDDDLLMHRAFINAVRTGAQQGILCNFDDALRTLAVTLACQQSAAQSRPVLLSELL